MTRPKSVLFELCLIAVIAYLFATAPEPLANKQRTGQQVEIKKVFELVNEINNEARKLYTSSIVGDGKKQGLKFDENWQEDDVHAGPLPAQFLREMAKSLEQGNTGLGLYLGSDFPINEANHFTGEQKEYFRKVRQNRESVFFYVADIERYAIMFADVAVAKPCVSCHNKHPDSPKTDWKMQDVMGATTWTYPERFIGIDQALKLITALRGSVQHAYSVYIDEVKQFTDKPKVDQYWPSAGRYVPSVEVFMQEVDRRISVIILHALMDLVVQADGTGPEAGG